jgi:hypothetical protein
MQIGIKFLNVSYSTVFHVFPDAASESILRHIFSGKQPARMTLEDQVTSYHSDIETIVIN